jgi:hypothetical protein
MPVPILQETAWVPGPVSLGAENAPHWDTITDYPARSESPYLPSDCHQLANAQRLCVCWQPYNKNLFFSYVALNGWNLCISEQKCCAMAVVIISRKSRSVCRIVGQMSQEDWAVNTHFILQKLLLLFRPYENRTLNSDSNTTVIHSEYKIVCGKFLCFWRLLLVRKYFVKRPKFKELRNSANSSWFVTRWETWQYL